MSCPSLLLKTVRSNYDDAEFFGHLALFDSNGAIFELPKLTDRIFFLRSLAKPIQVSLLVDFGLDKILTSKQIAVASGSHIGEDIHTKVVREILEKFNLGEDMLQCGTHPPLSEKVRDPKPINNNCSGKHALMLTISKHKGWGLESYLEFAHPLQQFIYKKHQELCEYKDLILSSDGCGTPIFGLPLENIAKGYLNLFLDEKYKSIKNAFLEYPEIIGGVDGKGRLDTEIIQKGKSNLIAKVGAGGFLAVVNLARNEVLIIKMSQDNNESRKIVASKALKQLGWLDKEFAQNDILTTSGKKVAEYVECFKLSV